MHQKVSNKTSHAHGFTLIELSIVLVVVSLLVGGILVGNTMYQNTKLMSIMSDAERFRGNIINFKQRYNYYPGDFPNATGLWGAMTSPAACDTTGDVSNNRTSSTPVELTCDGRGNGVIGQLFADASQFSTAGADMRELREKFYVWQHLSLAGYLDDPYSGHSTSSSNNDEITPGINVPQTGYSEALGFTLQYWPTNHATQSATRSFPVQGRIGHVLSWSNPLTTVGINSNNLINSIDARKLDRKIDDGLPFSGDVFAHGRDGGSSGANSDVDDCTTGTKYKVDGDFICGQYYRNFLEK